MSIKTVLLRCDLGSNKGLGSIGEFCREIGTSWKMLVDLIGLLQTIK